MYYINSLIEVCHSLTIYYICRYECLGYFNVLSVPMSGQVPVHGLVTHKGVPNATQTFCHMKWTTWGQKEEVGRAWRINPTWLTCVGSARSLDTAVSLTSEAAQYKDQIYALTCIPTWLHPSIWLINRTVYHVPPMCPQKYNNFMNSACTYTHLYYFCFNL